MWILTLSGWGTQSDVKQKLGRGVVIRRVYDPRSR